MKHGLYTDLSNEDYHKDNGFLSSSRIKLILQSPELYYKKYIKKELKEDHIEAFDTGTAIHSRILEPEKYENDIVFFSGRRSGHSWNEFKTANAGKIILGDMQKMQLDRMYNSFRTSELGPKLISDGVAESSLFTSLEGVDIKVRADYINYNSRIIFDLKSQSGMIEEEKFRRNAEGKLYGYDLQAALYIDAYIEKHQQGFDFYWIVMSKDFDDIKFFKASPEFIEQGRRKYKQALKLIKQYEESGWNFKEDIIEIRPSNSWEEL